MTLDEIQKIGAKARKVVPVETEDGVFHVRQLNAAEYARWESDGNRLEIEGKPINAYARFLALVLCDEGGNPIADSPEGLKACESLPSDRARKLSKVANGLCAATVGNE